VLTAKDFTRIILPYSLQNNMGRRKIDISHSH
jgi:hypothetical protein